ncbi:MAG TPA: PAS domain S-box protein, partial [Gaiellaceae bacterium]|nr:PAS domain S-box protein [Gaiellaceae bacterium]
MAAALLISVCLAVAAAVVGWVLALRWRARQRASEQLLARHREMSLDLICTSSFDGYFVQLNPSWTRVLGFELEELLTRPFVEFVHPDDLDATLAEVDKQAKSGQLVFNFQNRYLCADGSYRWLEWTSRPDYEANLMFAVARDVTERKQAEEIVARHQELLEEQVAERTTELEEARWDSEERARLLAQSNSELEQFASIASHDLQEPLRKIRMFGDRLMKRLGSEMPEESVSDARRIQDAAARMQRLIDDLLAFARVSSR